jgi:iron only hydrogenase large subunit-like protein
MENFTYESVRGLTGVKDATVQLRMKDTAGPLELNVAVCNQMANVKKFLSCMEEGYGKKYHVCEVMACPGGCIGGGGTPQSRDPDILSKRTAGLYSIDERKVKRKSHENQNVKKLYEHLLGSQLSDISHKVRVLEWMICLIEVYTSLLMPLSFQLLHTNYSSRPRKVSPDYVILKPTLLHIHLT